jgi:uncharacterized lipoprotein
MLKKLFFIFTLLALAGCSHIYGEKGVIKNHDVDYLRAQEVPPLKMPPGISNGNIETHYPVPAAKQAYTPSQKKVVLTPPELTNAPATSQ